ncbi:MAG: CAP domain-containing protein [Gammaproteobacteria bacterium]
MKVGLVIQFVLFVVLTDMGQERVRPRLSISALEQRIHESINAERVRNRLPGLELDEDLSHIARAHSLDMATRDFFDHVNPDGKTPSDRGDAGEFPCRKGLPDGSYTIGLAENLFQNNLYDRVMFVDGKASYAWSSLEHIAATTVQGWMDSRDHRTNILNRSHDRSGIGIALTPDDKVLITQLFC